MKETPSQLPFPSFVMNFPFSFSTENPNNIWMQEMSSEELKVNRGKAYKQFMDLYNFVSGAGFVCNLPSHGNKFQDLVYVANMGIYLPHIKDSNNIIMSNFTSTPIQGEELVGKPFFDLMNYQTYDCPYKFEGEADLKYLHGNNYIGGYGIRSSKEAFEWMEEKFDMNIIKLEMVDEYLYHLDCNIFPLSKSKTLVCPEFHLPEEIKEIEKYTEIVEVSADNVYNGICNSARVGNMILCASNISELSINDEAYDAEKHKIHALEKICYNEGLEPIIFNISEFMKSGAMLSCMIMHLNYVDYERTLI